MKARVWRGEVSRREFLARSVRWAAGATLVPAWGVLGGCTASRQQGPVPEPQVAGLPRIPKGSPDFDTLNTLLQLEYRAAALGEQALQGFRLGERAAGAVGAMADNHRRHAERLRQLVAGAGATPDPPRHRYSLPTPLGDEKRALTVLRQDESNLGLRYAEALARVEAVTLAGPLASILFSTQANAACLERLTDSCVDFGFDFVEPGPFEPVGRASPASPPPQAPIFADSGTVLTRLSEFETAASRVCKRAAEDVSERLRLLQDRKRDSSGDSGSPALARGLSVAVQYHCVVLQDPEGRRLSPASERVPSAVSVLEGDTAPPEELVPVVEALRSVLLGLASGHEQRAAYWSSQATELGQASAGGDGGPGAPGMSAGRQLEELSPTAVGLGEGDGARPGPDEGQTVRQSLDAVRDAEIKTARALSVAASNLASEELRSRVGAALSAVARATSRLVGLAFEEDFLVEGV